MLDQRYDPAFPIDLLVEFPGNPRRSDVARIEASMEAHGFFGAVLVQASTRRIIAGHGRTNAARKLGDTTVPVLLVDVDDDQASRMLLVDNWSNDSATYDDTELARLLDDLAATDTGLAGAGFTDADLTALLASIAADTAPAEVDAPVEAAPAFTVTGDVWELGPHRLICGSCRDPEIVARVLAGATINVAFTSPPYADRRPYDASSGFVPIRPDEFVEWFEPVAANVASHLAADGSWFVNIKAGGNGLDTETYVLDLVLAHVRRWGWHWATELCWERPGVPKQVVQRFKNQWEPVFQFTRDRWKMRPTNVRHPTDDPIIPFGPGRGNTSWADADSAVVSQGQRGDVFEGQRPRRAGRGDTSWKSRQGNASALPDDFAPAIDGWAFPGNRLPTFAGTHDAVGHAAAFPVGLPAWFARAYSDEGDTLFDPFTGSGSTLLAAHQTGRIGYGVELSPAYVDMTCMRFERATGIVPVRNGVPVSFVQASTVSGTGSSTGDSSAGASSGSGATSGSGSGSEADTGSGSTVESPL